MDLLLASALDGEEALRVIPMVSLVVGLAFCFFGYRIFRVLLVLVGFVVGGLLGLAVGGGAEGQAGGIVGFLVGGVVGAALFFALYYVGVFLYGAGIACLLVLVGSIVGGIPPHPIFLIVGGIVGGILALIFHRIVIILLTSGSGAWSAVLAGFYLAGRSTAFEDLLRSSGTAADPAETYRRVVEVTTPMMLAAWIVLAVLGAIVQFGVTGKKKDTLDSVPHPPYPPPPPQTPPPLR